MAIVNEVVRQGLSEKLFAQRSETGKIFAVRRLQAEGNGKEGRSSVGSMPGRA